MTTAARPTFYAAVGKQDYGGIKSRHVSAKDQNAQTKLKYRQVGQSSAEEMRHKDLRTKLDDKEEEEALGKNAAVISLIKNEEKKVDVPLLLKNIPESANAEDLKKYDDADVDAGKSSDGFDSSSDEEEEEDDDEDDEEELQAELERIKHERAAAQARKEQEAQEVEDAMKKETAMMGNPLLNQQQEDSNAKVKRRWNDDVVFRNQARDEPELKKRFVNDTIRSDFHRSFLKKFMK